MAEFHSVKSPVLDIDKSSLDECFDAAKAWMPDIIRKLKQKNYGVDVNVKKFNISCIDNQMQLSVDYETKPSVNGTVINNPGILSKHDRFNQMTS